MAMVSPLCVDKKSEDLKPSLEEIHNNNLRESPLGKLTKTIVID